MNPLQQAVNRYHQQGFCVIPIAADSKVAAEKWEAYQERRPTADELKSWFPNGHRNLGLVCGAISKGLVVLDIDDTPLADQLADDVPLQAETTVVRTPRGGLHIYALETDAKTRNEPLEVPGRHIGDIRANGGYVLVPPSTIKGREYSILSNTSIMSVPDGREWAVGLLKAYGVEVPDRRREPLIITQAVDEMHEGNRNDSLFRILSKLRGKGLNKEEMETFAYQTGRGVGLDDQEIENILGSVLRYPAGAPVKEITASEPETEDAAQSYPVLVRLSDVTPRQVQWLWPSRIPLGKISIIAGDPGLMKSMLSLDMAARVSRGLPWPDGGNAPTGNVVLLTAEDDLDDTVRPRLDTLGADVDRITALTMVWTPEQGEVAFNLHDHLPMLEKAITTETKLVIIDPVLAFTGGTDTHVSAQVRGVLAPLAKLAQETQVSVTGIIHLNKKLAGNAFQRILASIDFSAAPRSVLLVGEDADDPKLRHFAVVKNNLAAPAETLTYRWSDGLGFTWTGKSDLSAHQLLAAPMDGEGRTALIEAKEILEDLLSAGAKSPTEIRKAAAAAGVKEATLRVAKDALGVKSVKLGFGEDGEWKWELPALRRGENTDPTLDGSDTKHQEPSPALGDGPILGGSTLNPDDGQRLYARSLWEEVGRPEQPELRPGVKVGDVERFIDTADAAELAALIAGLEGTA